MINKNESTKTIDIHGKRREVKKRFKSLKCFYRTRLRFAVIQVDCLENVIDDVVWSCLRFRLRLVLGFVFPLAESGFVRFSCETRGFFNEHNSFVCDKLRSSANAELLVDNWDSFCVTFGELSWESLAAIARFDEWLKIFSSAISASWSLSFSCARLWSSLFYHPLIFFMANALYICADAFSIFPFWISNIH